MTTIATSPTAIATRPRLRNDAMSLLHANARTLAMRVATLPEQQQALVLASLFETLAAHGVRASVVQCSMQGTEVHR